jgi:hypothetical protein
MQKLEAMSDILGQNTKLNPLALFDRDLWHAPPASLKNPGHKPNLPGLGMRRLSVKMGVQHAHRQNHDNQQDDDPGQKFSRFHSLVS